MISLVDSLFVQGGTNYYKAFLNIEEIIKEYQPQEGRECIVLILTDGYPNADVPNQIGEIDEKVESEKTPVLASSYLVEYEVNEPIGCQVERVPESRYEGVGTKVEVSDIVPSCEGYHFNGDLFLMPESDVLIRGEWSKLSITKSLDGEVY